MTATINALYFSPTHTTARIVHAVVEELARQTGLSVRAVDFTLPDSRPIAADLSADDVLVFGFPVYAGRVPELVAAEMARLAGAGSPAIILGLYGNRDYDDALLEAADLVRERGFSVVAAGAFVGEHSMTARVAAKRPDASDIEIAQQFGSDIASKLASGITETPAIEGKRPYKNRPAPADIRPQTTDECTACGMCAAVCPMGIISPDDPTQVSAGCLRCNACVKRCPERAKFFDSELTNGIVAMLEEKFIDRKEPELFW